jgi:hypothetical protein
MNNDTNISRKNFLLETTGAVFTEADYQALSDQIEVHKYLINQNIPWTITWDDAAFSWLENVYQPIMQVVDHWEIRSAFNKHDRARIFFDISDHWYFLMEKNPSTPASLAAVDYAAKYGRGLGKWMSKLILPKKVA